MVKNNLKLGWGLRTLGWPSSWLHSLMSSDPSISNREFSLSRTEGEQRLALSKISQWPFSTALTNMPSNHSNLTEASLVMISVIFSIFILIVFNRGCPSKCEKNLLKRFLKSWNFSGVTILLSKYFNKFKPSMIAVAFGESFIFIEIISLTIFVNSSVIYDIFLVKSTCS
ncbi:hypothetical protein AWRI1631_121560 [Saccharomyces cerevisiae AWRI1631]|uniref:Uncharacterized protein n=1 Tax=Saccharomyces cerevisiae (strain AWRI1631) TaxID=545124 RepID=B5VN44_YEAS6|nr:hypothetical protein AWRI1631_121560 [Saccharomyces cerevisiae AWRI1631]